MAVWSLLGFKWLINGYKRLWIKEFRLKPYFIHKAFCRKKKIILTSHRTRVWDKYISPIKWKNVSKVSSTQPSINCESRRLVKVSCLHPPSPEILGFKFRLHLIEKDTLTLLNVFGKGLDLFKTQCHTLCGSKQLTVTKTYL